MPLIELGHGSGGRQMRGLIRELFLRYLDSDELRMLEDSAYIRLNPDSAMTTDSYVIKPIFFPGGDIGKLSICGTVNDLIVKGAIPRYISIGFIIEEGMSIDDLEDILKSIQRVAMSIGVKVVTGDTKVVEKGKCDSIYINTTGVGEVVRPFSTADIRVGDRIIVTGTVGDHGTAIALVRNGFDIETSIESDCAALNNLLLPILEIDGLRWMRDPTRGGLATVLCELSEVTGLGIRIFENDVPVRDDVRFISDMLGYDPLYLANEGKAVIVASEKDADAVISKLREDELGRDASIIGMVTDEFKGVRLRTRIGGERLIELLDHDMLPRIC
ncbi:MAG: hydrogenase expression/formation protein HypE [Thermodesulfovibrionia bacterium]